MTWVQPPHFVEVSVDDTAKWYNQEHRHSGLGLMTSFVMHFGHAAHLREQQKRVLASAFERHPERFVKGLQQPAELPTAVWINPPVSPEKSCEQAGPEEVMASETATDNTFQNDSTGHAGDTLARTLSQFIDTPGCMFIDRFRFRDRGLHINCRA